MQVSLRLKRAYTAAGVRAFDVERDIPAHCGAAAVALFVSDTLRLSEEANDAEAFAACAEAARKLSSLLLSSQKVMLTTLQGGVSCTLRAAAFTAWLVHLPPQVAAESGVLRWAADHCLHGNVGEAPWSLTDLMFALESLACHWERLCAEVWARDGQRGLCNPGSPLPRYLHYLWRQCRRFVVEDQGTLASSVHTLPYAAETEGGLHQVSVSPATVTTMCEIWRHVEAPRRLRWCLDAYAPRDADTATFLNLLSFEKNQLTVDKFRENLRERFAHRVLLVGCLLYTSPSPRDRTRSRMPSSA